MKEQRMATADLSQQILQSALGLSEPQQRQVLAFIQSLRGAPAKTGADFVQLAGTISVEDLRLMEQAIEDGCEQVDPHGW
jgi:hypothetical protein